MLYHRCIHSLAAGSTAHVVCQQLPCARRCKRVVLSNDVLGWCAHMLLEKQILHSIRAATCPGGKMVYSCTCILLPTADTAGAFRRVEPATLSDRTSPRLSTTTTTCSLLCARINLLWRASNGSTPMVRLMYFALQGLVRVSKAHWFWRLRRLALCSALR